MHFKRLTAQIFIEEVHQNRTLTITPTRTALEILNYFRSNNTIAGNEGWTLFEVINKYGLGTHIIYRLILIFF
jgi:hypothetical protein